jgi:hypothetical protein
MERVVLEWGYALFTGVRGIVILRSSPSRMRQAKADGIMLSGGKGFPI